MGFLSSLLPWNALASAAGNFGAAVFNFLRTPIGQVVALALSLAAAFVAGEVREHHALARKHKAEIAALNAAWVKREQDAAARYEEIRVARDAEIANRVAASNQTRIRALEHIAADLDNQVKQYENATKTDAACRLDDADLGRVRVIRRRK